MEKRKERQREGALLEVLKPQQQVESSYTAAQSLLSYLCVCGLYSNSSPAVVALR